MAIDVTIPDQDFKDEKSEIMLQHLKLINHPQGIWRRSLPNEWNFTLDTL